MFCLKVARLEPIDYIKCPRTKEITLDNKIRLFCWELNGNLFKMKIESKELEIDRNNRETVNPSFILSRSLFRIDKTI